MHTYCSVCKQLFIYRANREARQAYLSPLMTRMYCFRIPSSSLWLLFWYHGRCGRNRKSTCVSIQIIQFGSQGLLDTGSQFWTFSPSRLLLPAAVTLGFSEYKLLLSFSMTCSPSWKKQGNHLPSHLSVVSINGNEVCSFLIHKMVVKILRKLIRKSCEMIIWVSVI